MVALNPPAVELGKKIPNFSLKNIDGKIITLADIAVKKGILVMFICNHCPFVKAIIDRLVIDAQKLQENGISVVAINSNNPLEYPEDSFEKMVIFARENNFNFPYLFDETQEVAKSFRAVCTPDFFGYNAKNELQFRGRFDDSGMSKKENSKHELLEAMIEIANTGRCSVDQKPSIGCSVKWK